MLALAAKVSPPGTAQPAAPVHVRTRYGTERLLLRLSGEQLPRIC